MGISERIKLIIRWLIGQGIASNQEDIGKLLGYNNKSSFSQVVNGKKPLPANFLDKIIDLDKRVNKVWLLTGEGEMLKPNSTIHSGIVITTGGYGKNIVASTGSGAISNSSRDTTANPDVVTDLQTKIKELENEIIMLKTEINILREIQGLSKKY